MPFLYNLKWFENISASLTNFLFLTAEGNKSLAHNKSWGAEVNRSVKYPVENKKKELAAGTKRKREILMTWAATARDSWSKITDFRVKVTRKASQSDSKSESKWPEKRVKVTRKASQSDPKSELKWTEKRVKVTRKASQIDPKRWIQPVSKIGRY